MRKALLALLLALPALADTQQRIEQGIALYDAKRYDDAIAVFESVLAEEPQNELAAYELALTFAAKGDNAKCRAVLEPRVGVMGRLQGSMHALLGNCLDNAGETDRAIAVYRKGLKIAPKETQLLYNLALTLFNRTELDEPRELLKREMPLRPDHASARYLLARIFEEQNFRAAAIAEYLRFLALESRGERAHYAATRLRALLSLGVDAKDKNNINISIDPNAPKGEGDYTPWLLGVAVASAGRLLPENEKLSEFEAARRQLVSSIHMLIELAKDDNYTARHNVPYFAALSKQKQLETFAGAVLLPLDLDGAVEWRAKNEAAIAALRGAR